MNLNLPKLLPSNICIFCGNNGPFSSKEHIVPHSLGNDLLVLQPGWVCDQCNNICSSFESRILNSSILGLERCRLGVVTKKRKPARSDVHGVSWFAEPELQDNIVSASADWEKIPILHDANNSSGKIAMPLHDETCYDIAKLLLKMGLEILAPTLGIENMQLAKDHIIGKNNTPWPYFILKSNEIEKKLVSLLNSTPEEHEYIRSSGFDLFFHEVEDKIVFFFVFGQFRAGVSLSSRDTIWRQILLDWEIPHVGCPIEFEELNA